MNEDLDKFVEERMKQKEAEDKAQAEMQAEKDAKAKALMDLAKKPVDIVKASVSNKIANKVQTDENTIKRIDETADKLVDSGLETVKNEADAAKNQSEKDKLDTYFQQHKEELKTAGIDEPTYMEDMERGVKCHRKWSDVHWRMFGWWQTGVRTFIQKAKPFKVWLNIMATILCLTITGGAIWGIIELIKLIAR